jgi:hypothetical protein
MLLTCVTFGRSATVSSVDLTVADRDSILSTMQVNKPTTALDAQAKYASYLTTDSALNMREAFCGAYLSSSKNIQFVNYEVKVSDNNMSTDHPPTTIEQQAFALGLRDNERNVFTKGRTIFLTTDAADLINESAAALPEEVLLESEAPDYPFVLWLETPHQYDLLSVNSDGTTSTEKWGIRAVAVRRESSIGREGASTGPGLMMTLYADPECILQYGYTEVPAHLKNCLVLVDLLPMRFGLSWWERHDETGAHWVRDFKQWIVAMFRLMDDHIEREPVKLDRATSRRELRRGRPADGYLTVLRLRKVIYTDKGIGGGAGGSAEFRHLVRGHWRKFYCPSMKKPVGDPAAYRHRYVNNYVRGPKEVDFIPSRQVISISR